MRERVEALMRLPWTVRVRKDNDGTLVAQIAEIPDAIGTGEEESDLAKDLWESLWASLEVRLAHDDAIQLPSGFVLPWENSAAPVPGQQATAATIRRASGDLVVEPRATVAEAHS